MSTFIDYFGPFSSTVHGLMVSSILIPASLTSFFAGTAADVFGRTLAISIGGLIFMLGTALEAAAQNMGMFFAGRCITGVGEGLFLSTLIVYVCEIAPARQRGVLASIQQQLVTCGICGGYFVCYGTVRATGSSFSWRLPFALQSFLAFSYGVSVYVLLPQSPRWLKTQGRYDEATRAWDRLGVSDAEREKDEELRERRASESHHHRSSVLDQGVLEPESLALAPIRSRQSAAREPDYNWLRIFSPGARKRTALGAFLMGMQQLSGIDGVLYYAPLLFQQAGLSSSTSSFLASGISALLMMLITIPSFLLCDKWGRRTSTMTGGFLLAACMLSIGALYASNSVHATYGAGRWVVIVLIYVFALSFSVTWAVGIKVYASEIQPLETRAPATSLAQSTNWIVNFVVAFTTPIFLTHSTSGIYFMFGAASMLTVAVCAIAMPETRGRTLEDIDAAFQQHRSSSVSPYGTLEKLASRLRAWTTSSRRVDHEEHEL